MTYVCDNAVIITYYLDSVTTGCAVYACYRHQRRAANGVRSGENMANGENNENHRNAAAEKRRSKSGENQ